MCSLSVLPAVGSNISVHITSVNLNLNSALVQFGGNFNHGQLTREIYRQMRKEIQIHKERESDFEGKPGDVCLVEEEKTWHRARIISKCLDKYYVFLIDDGRTLWISRSFLAWGQSSLFNLPPMTEFFILSDVLPLCLKNSWSPAASEFLKDLKGKIIHGCVQHVMMPYRIILLDIPDVFIQMNELGLVRKTTSEKFKLLVSDSLHSPRTIFSQTSLTPSLSKVQLEHVSEVEKMEKYLYPKLLPGTIETVEVTQVIHPLNIFCKLHVFSQELTKLNKHIHEYYESTSVFVMARPQSEGSPCATKGSDGKWYRSVLQQNIVSNIVKVLHVDYGMGDFVKVENVRQLAAKFFKLPVVTYACSLYSIVDKGTGWTTGQIDYLRSILLHQIFVGKFEHQRLSGGVYYVTLYGNDGVNINKSFGIKEHCLTESTYVDSAFQTRSQGSHKDFPEPLTYSVNPCAFSQESASHEKMKISGHAKSKLLPGEASTGVQNHKRAEPDFSNEGKLVSGLEEHLFTIGSVIEVNVSYIENDQRFWCQMVGNASRFKMLMHHLQNYYSCSPFQWPTGSDCVARHPENGMWCRARIVAHCLSPGIEVCLVDHGQRFQAPLQDLRPIDPEFLKLKCQAIQCCLLNQMNFLRSESSALNQSVLSEFLGVTDPTLLSRVSLRIIIRGVMYDSYGMVLNLVDIENLSQNFCTSLLHKHLGIPAMKSIAKPSVSNSTSDVPDSINIGAKEKIWITCVKGVNQFYGQLEQNAARVEKMTIDIQKICVALQHTRCKFLPQMMCLAKYNDGKWHRGIIRSINPQFIVHFVDYGDVLPLDESYVLPFPAQPSKSMSIPFQAIQLRLFNVTLEESSELNSWFEDYVIDHIFTGTVLRKNPSGKLSVELHDGATNINMMVKEKWNEIQKKDHTTKEMVDKMSHNIVKPLWRQDHFNYKLQVCKDFSSNTLKSYDQSNFTVGKDEKKQDTEVTVFADELGIVKDAVQKQIDQSKHATLVYSKHTDLPLRILKPGLVSEVLVSHCNSPSSFFVQFSSEEKEMISIAEKLNCSQLCDSQIDFQQLLTGDLVKAEYPLHGAWYRAVVQNKLGDGRIHVEFIDFGNEATLSILKVRQLDSQFLKFPRYTVQCSLSVGDGEGKRQWTKEQIATFKNHTLSKGKKKLLCSFIKEVNSVWQVRVEDQGIMLSETLLEVDCPLKFNPDNVAQTICFKNDSPREYKNPEVSLGQTLQGYASSIVGPDYFWCQYADTELLNRISVIAQETGNSGITAHIKIDSLNPGDPCLALFPDDKMWYRAQVISISANSVSVLFVDYGNESEINQSSVKAISSSLMETPPQAFLCQLEGFRSTDGSWNNAAADRFFELLVDEPLKVCIKNVLVMPVSYKFPKFDVQVECNKVLVNDLLRTHWNDSLFQVCEQTTHDSCLNSTVDYKKVTNLETYKKEGNLYSYLPEFMDAVLSPCEVAPSIHNTFGYKVIQNASQLDTNLQHFNEQSECAVTFTKQCKEKETDMESLGIIKSSSNTQDDLESSTLDLSQISNLPTMSIESGFISEVYVSHINSSISFFVQLVKDENCLISLTEQLNSIPLGTEVQVSAIKNGSLVKSVFPDDESWYRAVVKEANGKDEVHVEFIDFGNDVTVSQMNVCKLDEQFLQFPRFSIHCCFGNEECVKMQKEMVQGLCPLRQILGEVGGKKFCKFIKENNTVWEVKIADQRSTLESLEDISQETLDDGQQNTSTNEVLSNVMISVDISFTIKKQKFPIGQTIDVYASFVVGPNYFWCQYGNSEELDKIALIAQECGNSMEKNLINNDQLCPGDPCLALFSDKMWYRAEVVKKSSSFSVVFVDYGNESEIQSEHIKLLPRPLLEFPAQAFLCQLEGFKSSNRLWNHNATEKFCELVLDKPLKMTIQKIENLSDGLTPVFDVRLQSKECVINEQMKSFWNASECTVADTRKAVLDVKSSVPHVQSVLQSKVSVIPVESCRTVSNRRVSHHESEDGESFKNDGDLNETDLKNGLWVEDIDVHFTTKNNEIRVSNGTWISKNPQNNHQFEDLPHQEKAETSIYGTNQEWECSDVLYEEADNFVTQQYSPVEKQMLPISADMDFRVKQSESISSESHVSN